MLLHPHLALVKAAAGDPFEVEFVNAIIATGAKPGRCRRRTRRAGAGPELCRFQCQSDLARSGIAYSRTGGRRNRANARDANGTARRFPGARCAREQNLPCGRWCLCAIPRSEGAANRAYGEYVLQVAGHQARTEGLGPDHTEVRNDRHGIPLSHVLETDDPGLYAAGDVIGRSIFAYWAAGQSLRSSA